VGANAVTIGLWLWLFRPVFDYLAIIFSRADFRTNQLVLIGVILLIAGQARKGRLRPRLDAAPHLFYPAGILVIGGSALYLAVERFLDINTLSASLFGLASYGLLGLWMDPRRWRQGLPAALLLIGALPFGEHMQTFVGYPMRILTAALVRDGLAAADVSSISVDTILVLENGVSHIDLPCSGVKSLWTGMLFLTAATWIDRRPFNLSWLLIAFVFAGLLFAANLARVGVLVVVGQVAGWRLIAEMLHIPLGVLGFAAVCVLAVILLRMGRSNRPDVAWAPGSSQGGESNPHAEVRGLGTIGGRSGEPVQLSSEDPALAHPNWFAPALAAAILVMILIYTPRPHTGLTQPPPAWEFSAELVTEPMPLKPDEIDWLTRGGAESADRRRFEWQGITGSMMLITSKTWRAHHRPERCFEVYGLSLDDSRTYLITPEFPLRFLSLSHGTGHSLLSATYWFQSVDHTTDDYATRMWADLAPDRDRWVLVTILFDGVHDPSTADLQALYSTLHDSVAHGLEGGLR
jgi:exosortase/archaeosortase family protein